MPPQGRAGGPSVRDPGARAAPPLAPARGTSCCPCSPQKRLPGAGTILQKRLFLCTKKAHRPGSGPAPEPEPPPAASRSAISFPPHPARVAGRHLEAPPLREPSAKLKAQDGGGAPVQPRGVRAGAGPGLRGEVSGGPGVAGRRLLAAGRFLCPFWRSSLFAPRSMSCPSDGGPRSCREAADGADEGKDSSGAGLEAFRGPLRETGAAAGWGRRSNGLRGGGAAWVAARARSRGPAAGRRSARHQGAAVTPRPPAFCRRRSRRLRERFGARCCPQRSDKAGHDTPWSDRFCAPRAVVRGSSGSGGPRAAGCAGYFA